MNLENKTIKELDSAAASNENSIYNLISDSIYELISDSVNDFVSDSVSGFIWRHDFNSIWMFVREEIYEYEFRKRD